MRAREFLVEKIKSNIDECDIITLQAIYKVLVEMRCKNEKRKTYQKNH